MSRAGAITSCIVRLRTVRETFSLGSQSLADRWGATIAGPIDEETLKALRLMLLVLIAAAEMDTSIDGLVYGAFIGLGFQILEDFQ